MRVHATNTAGFAAAASAARRRSGGAFSLGESETSRSTTGASAPRAVGGIDALLALQAVDEPGERRKRAVKRGRIALDALDELKLGVIVGTLDTVALTRLQAAAATLAEQSGDAGLDTVMAEIGLRAEVELAKFASVRKR